jgi:hypothetical protein
MTKTWRAVLSAGLLLALAGALTVVPVRKASGPQLVGTAQAADAGNRFETIIDVLQWVREFGEGGEVALKFPRAWAPIARTASAAERASVIRERAAVYGQRLVRNDWTCATARFLEAKETFDRDTKMAAETYAERYRANNVLVLHATPDEARGFVEQAAELGKPLLIKVYKAAACEEGD